MPSMRIRQALTEKPDPKSAIVVTARPNAKVEIIGRQDDLLNVCLVDVLDRPSGWVPKSTVSDADPPAEPIDKDQFARECWRSAIYVGVNPHYMVAVAEMRSGVTNDANDKEIGPFRLLQAEWDADWNGKELAYQYDARDISNWRSQCSMFALMVHRTMDQIGPDRPSALELYLAQIIGAKAAAAMKQDPSKTIDTILGAIAASDMPKGNLSVAELIERHARFLKSAGAAATGQQVYAAITLPLQQALNATKQLILAGGLSVLDSPASALSQTSADGVAKIKIEDVVYTQYAGGGDIDFWIAQACQAAGLPHADAWVQGYKTLCSRESSRLPNNINTTDGNAHGIIVQDGHPLGCSRGIAQCVPETFASYHVAGTSKSIYDPVANIAASMQYVRHRYHVSSDGSDLAKNVQQADPTRRPHWY